MIPPIQEHMGIRVMSRHMGKKKTQYEVPEAEELHIKYENNIMSNESIGGGDDPDNPWS